MEIVAQVFDWKISKTELEFEETRLINKFPDADPTELKLQAMDQIIDRYLLMHDALNHGITITDDEYEMAFFDLIDFVESPAASVLVNRSGRGKQLEMIVRSNLIITKYLKKHYKTTPPISDEKLYQFYLDRKDFFYQEEAVRASHILMKGINDETFKKIKKVRECINNSEDFASFSLINSECPSGMNYGDLGFFPRGRMIPEIDEVAFSLRINEISQPFKTNYGYHILMVTDRKEKQIIPFEQIKDCLKASLAEIEREMMLSKLINSLKEQNRDKITIFDNALQ